MSSNLVFRQADGRPSACNAAAPSRQNFGVTQGGASQAGDLRALRAVDQSPRTLRVGQRRRPIALLQFPLRQAEVAQGRAQKRAQRG